MYRPTSTLSLGELTVAVDLPNHFMGLGVVNEVNVPNPYMGPPKFSIKEDVFGFREGIAGFEGYLLGGAALLGGLIARIYSGVSKSKHGSRNVIIAMALPYVLNGSWNLYRSRYTG